MRLSNLSQVSILCSLNKTAVRKQNNFWNAGGKKQQQKKGKFAFRVYRTVWCFLSESLDFFYFSSQGQQTQKDHGKDGTLVCANTDFQDLWLVSPWNKWEGTSNITCQSAAAVKTGSNAVYAVRQTHGIFAEATDVALIFCSYVAGFHHYLHPEFNCRGTFELSFNF